MEQKIKHLEMIERIIERMASNSFMLKGWTVTMVVLVGTLSAQGSDKRFFLLAFVPIIAFWILDSYYFHLERKYQILYKNVARKSYDQIDFDMDLGTLSCCTYDKKRISFIKCLLSKTESLFYCSIAGAMLVLGFILKIT